MYRVGIAGYGTVGTGVAELLITHKNLIKEKTGLELELSAVLDKDWQRERPFKIDDSLKVSSLKELLDRVRYSCRINRWSWFCKRAYRKSHRK